FIVFFLFNVRHSPRSTLFPYTTLFRSKDWSFNTAANHPFWNVPVAGDRHVNDDGTVLFSGCIKLYAPDTTPLPGFYGLIRWDSSDRKSTRLNSSHVKISYAVFCLKKKK